MTEGLVEKVSKLQLSELIDAQWKDVAEKAQY